MNWTHIKDGNPQQSTWVLLYDDTRAGQQGFDVFPDMYVAFYHMDKGEGDYWAKDSDRLFSHWMEIDIPK